MQSVPEMMSDLQAWFPKKRAPILRVVLKRIPKLRKPPAVPGSWSPNWIEDAIVSFEAMFFDPAETR